MTFNDLISDILWRDVEVTLKIVDADIWYDLNLLSKSHLYIKPADDNSIYCHTRYHAIPRKVDCDFDSLLRIVRECKCGRDYMSNAWEKILKEEMK